MNYGGGWRMHLDDPCRSTANMWWYSRSGIGLFVNGVDWQGDWKESTFSRKEIQERWEQEYGSDWLSKAMEDAR